MAENYTPQFVSTFVNDTSAVTTVNNNFAAISAVLQDVMSLSGVQPNAMQSALNMNSNQIINLPPPASLNSPMRLADALDLPSGTIVTANTGTSGHTVPFLDGTNTWSNPNEFTSLITNPSLAPAFSIFPTISGTLTPGINVCEIGITDSTNVSSNYTFGLNVGLNTGGGSSQGNKIALLGTVDLTSTPLSGFAPTYVGMQGTAETSSNVNGTSASSFGASSGQFVGAVGTGQTGPGATFLTTVAGIAGSVSMNSSSSAWSKACCVLSAASNDGATGTIVDAMLWMFNEPGTPTRWRNGILIDNNGSNGVFPIATTGTVMKVGPGTIGTGIDMSTCSFNSAQITFPGFSVGATGAISTGAPGAGGQITFVGSSSGSIVTSTNSTGTLFTISQPVQIGVIGTSGTGQLNIAGGTSGSAQISASATGGSLVLGSGNVTITSTGNISTAGTLINIADNLATPAGGAVNTALFFGLNNYGIYFGSGAPTVSASQGSLYIRTDGSSTSTRLYVNTNGTTGWTNFTSAT